MIQRRRKRVTMPAWALARLVQLPEGATIEAMHYSIETHSLHLIVNHPTFSETPEGTRLPLLTPTVCEVDGGGLRVDWGIEGDGDETKTAV